VLSVSAALSVLRQRAGGFAVEALPVVDGTPPTSRALAALKEWLSARQCRYADTHVLMFHGTSAAAPVQTDGLLPTSATRRRSMQSSPGYVYLAASPWRAQMFAEMAYPGEAVQVVATAVSVRRLLPDRDLLRNLSLVERSTPDTTVASSLLWGGSARVKGAVAAWAICEVQANQASPVATAAAPRVLGM